MLVCLPTAAICLLAALAGAQDRPPAQDPPTEAAADAADDGQDPVAVQDPQRLQTDEVVLQNGDVLHGRLTDFRDGRITFETDNLGALEVPLSRVTNLSTAEPIVVVTETRTHVQGRIRSVVGDQLQIEMDDGSFTTVPVADWDAMRFPGGRPVRWRGSLSIGGRLSTGNTEERVLNSDLNFRRRSDIDRIIGGLSYYYDEDFNDATGRYELDERRANVQLQYDYFLGPEAYGWGLGQVNTDSEAEVDRRVIAGLGGGYQFAETDSLHFEAMLGAVHYEKVFRTAEPTLSYPAARIAYNLDWEFLSGARLIQEFQVVPSLEDPLDEYYMRAVTRFRVTVIESLFTELTWKFDYDSAPAAGRDRADSLVVLNIGWSF